MIAKKMKALGLSALPLLLMSSLAFGQEAAETPPVEEEPPTEEAAEAEAAMEAQTGEEAGPVLETPEPAADASPPVAEEPPQAAEAPAPEGVVEKTEEAAAAATPETVAAPASLLPLTVGTSTWSRFEMRQGYDTLGVARTRFYEGDGVVFRARLALATNPLDLGGLKGTVHISPQASGVWGTSGTGGTVGEANMGIYEGYFKFAGERAEVKGGRFAMNYGDALVIGNLDWHQSGRAFDGLHAKYKMNKGFVDAFATQVASGWGVNTDPFLAGDTYFWGVYSSFGGYIAEGMDLDLYLLGLSVASTENMTDDQGNAYNRDGATLFTLGARAKQKIGFIDYRAEADLQFGDSSGTPNAGTAAAVSTLAYQADGELGLNFTDDIRLGLGALIASGEDNATAKKEAYTELFPTTHKWLGLMDVIGLRTNAASGFAKFSAGLGKGYGVMVHGHLFARPGDGGLGRVMGGDSFAGGEIDAQLAKKLGKYGLVRGLYGIFIPNAGSYASSDPAHYVEVQGGIDF